MSVLWTREAVAQLMDIEAFIARDNPVRAVTFVDELIDHTETALAENPRPGRIVPEIARSEIRELIYRNYRIVYWATGDHVEILTVFEGHRLLRSDEIGA